MRIIEKEKNAAALAAEQAAKAKEPVGGSGYQQWDEGVQDAVQPDLGYAKQASGALPRTNKINGAEATEAQMSWAEKYYGAKFARDPAARYKKNKEFKQSLWKKMAILNAIAALTGNTSQAEQYATYALGMHEDAMQFDDDMRMHKMHKAVYFRPDGKFDPPKNSEAAYNRAIQIGASPEEAKEVYGFAPKKTAKQMFWRPGADGKPEIKYADKGVPPKDDGKGIWRTDAVDDPREYAKSPAGKMLDEVNAIKKKIVTANQAGDKELAGQLETDLQFMLSYRNVDSSSQSTNANRVYNIYEDSYKLATGNLAPIGEKGVSGTRPPYAEWLLDEDPGGGAQHVKLFGLDISSLQRDNSTATDAQKVARIKQLRKEGKSDDQIRQQMLDEKYIL